MIIYIPNATNPNNGKIREMPPATDDVLFSFLISLFVSNSMGSWIISTGTIENNKTNITAVYIKYMFPNTSDTKYAPIPKVPLTACIHE